MHKLSCPLCDSLNSKIVNIFTIDELNQIWKQIDITKYIITNIVELYHCNQCHLEYFNPLVSGNSDFYHNIATNDYYKISWDYKKIYSLIHKYEIKSIMDYGCGGGGFLKLLSKDIKKVGFDHNAILLKSENLFIEPKDLNNFISDELFDMVICVQVLEHVENIKLHISNIIDSLKEKGLMIISVPNREGIISEVADEFNSLDFLPHHLSRWNKSTLENIAKIFNLELIEIISEPLSFTHYKWAKNSYLATSYGDSFVNKIIRKISVAFQNVYISNEFSQLQNKIDGHSIMAIYRKK